MKVARLYKAGFKLNDLDSLQVPSNSVEYDSKH